MDSKIFKTLEYQKILNKLSHYAQTATGQQTALRLQPSDDLEHIKKMLKGTDDTYAADRLKGVPSFNGVVDITPAVKRARIGGTLSPHELLGIRTTVQASHAVYKYT